MSGIEHVEHLLLGPDEHGVTRHAAALAGPRRRSLTSVGPGARDLASALADAAGPVHLHLTDHLLGDDAGAVARGLDVLAEAPRPVHLTLHDIPQRAEGEARYERRRDVYRRLVGLAASVQVCSEHERDLLEGMTDRPVDAVVRLPIDVAPDAASVVTPQMQAGPVGMLGFVHPGKNPGAALAAAARAGRDLRLLGALGPGHDDLLDALRAQAATAGVRCELTGHLTEAEMDAQIASISVPLAPYRHVSASGSIGRWIAAGRRPVVLRNPWVEELARHAPWSVRIVDADGLADAVVAAGEDVESTLTGGRSDGLLTTADAAHAQAEALAEVAHG